MSDVERTEWPSEKRLHYLRAQGVVPFSPSAAVLIRTAIVLVGILLVAATGKSAAKELKGVELTLESVGGIISSHLFALFLLPAILVVVGAVGSSLLQTLFLLPWGRLGFRWPGLEIVSIASGMRVFFLQVLALLIAGGVAYCALPQVLASLTLTPATITSTSRGTIALVVAIAAFFLIVAAAFFVGLSHLLFRYRYRMTRDDLEHESDESSIPKVL